LYRYNITQVFTTDSYYSTETLCLLFSNSFTLSSALFRASLVAQLVKNPPVMQETQVDPWVEKIPRRRTCQPTPVFLPGESHGQRSLGGYSP